MQDSAKQAVVVPGTSDIHVSAGGPLLIMSFKNFSSPPGNFFSHVDPFLLGEIELFAQCSGVLNLSLGLFESVWKISSYYNFTGLCANSQNGSSIEAEFRQRR